MPVTSVFLISFAVATVATVATLSCWAILSFTLPTLKHSQPDHFAAAGRPHWLSWHPLRLGFFRYLMSDAFRAIPDRKLVSRLLAVKCLWILALIFLAIMFAAALAG